MNFRNTHLMPVNGGNWYGPRAAEVPPATVELIDKPLPMGVPVVMESIRATIGRSIHDGADHRSCTQWVPDDGREARCVGYHCGNCDAPTGMMGGCSNCGDGS